MTAENKSPPKFTRALEIERIAARWLALQDRAVLVPEQRQELDVWLADELANRVAYWRLKAAWSRSERLIALRPARSTPKLAEGKSVWSRVKMRLPVVIALVVTVTATVLYGTAYVLKGSDQKAFATGFGERKTLKLADGSTIELNTDTSVRVSVTRTLRQVWLDKGEAYFQVKHDTEHAFTVTMGDRSVTDLGTQFSIRREREKLTVSVIQGRVLFDTVSRSKTPTLLAEGDTAVVAGATLLVKKDNARRLSDRSAWRHGMLVFDQVSLADAAAEFNRYNETKIFIRDKKVARRTIGATFPIRDVDEFVDVAQDVLKLRVEKSDSKIIISE